MSARVLDPFEAPFDARRAYFLLKGLYCLLAADLYFSMIEHGARYSIGGFNAAHFDLFDTWLPNPGAPLYVGLLIVSGHLAVTLALGTVTRATQLLLAATYTVSWLISLHDSYQHHYLLSWLLLWAAAYPAARETELERGALVRGWGVPMTAITCAIVYAYTGISKCESDWRTGAVLRVLSRSKPPGDPEPGKFDAARDLLLELGLADAQVWQLFALGTIALQWTVALGYLAAPYRDGARSRIPALLASLALPAALSFHGAAELFEIFEIGLFSYYMLGIAVLLLAPLGPLAWLGEQLSKFARSLALQRTRLALLSAPASFSLAGLSLALLLTALLTIPLPGATAAGAALLLLALLRMLVVLRTSRDRLAAVALQTAASALVTWAALSQSSVPFDYYRRGAGELRRMGQLSSALDMYRVAELHAPRGQSRASEIRELERELGR